jgi:alpha-1,6-mannosyltransferase
LLAVPSALTPSIPSLRSLGERSVFDRFRILGFAGSVALALGGCAAGALPAADPFANVFLIHQLRQTPAVALVIAYGGLALLVVAWLFLGRLVGTPAGPGHRSLIITLAVWAAPLCLAPPMFSKDVYSYAAQGWLVQQGANPYFWGPAAIPGPFLPDVAGMWWHTPAPYGPVFLLLARVVVGLGGGHIVGTVLGLRLIALVGVVLMVWFVPRLARYCGVSPDRALWLGVLNPLVLLHFVSGAHNDALLVGLMVAGLALVLGRRPAIGVAVCALAVLVKAPAALALVFVVPIWASVLVGRKRLLRAAAYTAAIAGATIAGVTWATGLGYGWVAALQTPGAVRNWLSATTLLGEAAGALTKVVGLGDQTDRGISVFRGAGGVAALIICLLLLARVGRYGRGPAAIAALGTALTSVVVLSPVVQPWYVLWGFVLIAAGSTHVALRRAVITTSAVLSILLMPKGGTVDVSAIVQAVLGGLVVAGSAALFELLPLPGRPVERPAPAVSGTTEA